MEVVVHACLELSLSDANKVKLCSPRVRDLLVQVIKNALPGGEGVDLYNSETEVLMSAHIAIETLLQLSFSVEDPSALVADDGFLPPACGLERALAEFAVHSSADCAGTTIGLLLARLNHRQLPSIDREINEEQPRGRHIAFSYCWNKKARPELVSALAGLLRSKGYEVWRDVVSRKPCILFIRLNTYV
jgi:hypothetical protein